MALGKVAEPIGGVGVAQQHKPVEKEEKGGNCL